ncbi:hypothetical protein PA7078_00215 [Pseudomonas aeruginosa]
MKLPKLLAALALLAAPALAFAHPGHGEHGLVAGLAHPLTGLDHLLAMFAVGLWAAQQQGAARLALPCTFVGTMLVGGLLGFEGLQLPFMETGIAASVLALGLCVALAVRPPLPLAMAATALFALAHGVAHGLELPDLSSPWLYALGFVAATAALHAAGYALVRFLPQAAAPLVRLAGLASAGAGVLVAGRLSRRASPQRLISTRRPWCTRRRPWVCASIARASGRSSTGKVPETRSGSSDGSHSMLSPP